MKLVVGLGNPGPRYAESRHNVGFMVADELARRWKAAVWRYDRDFQGELAEASPVGRRVLLLKPATYMNLSGQSVGAAARFYKVAWSDVLVVLDDMDLPVGRVRVRAVGSAGGHKGLSDVLRVAGTQDVPRVRLGIGRVHRSATVEYVLSRFDAQEREAIELAVKSAADAAECWLESGPEAAMNRFNRKGEDESS